MHINNSNNNNTKDKKKKPKKHKTKMYRNEKKITNQWRWIPRNQRTNDAGASTRHRRRSYTGER
jgi:hypothetical protein